ncbi:adenosine receptor A3-like [Gastrophryne carolinensis]
MTHALSVYTAFMIATSIGAVGANLTLLLLFAFHLKLRKDTWALTLNLSLCDMIFGISVIPVSIYSSLSGSNIFSMDAIACKLLGFIFVLLQLGSLNSLVWATVDKFTEIRFPLRYAQIVTKKRIWTIVALLWIYAVAIAALPLTGFGEYTFSNDVRMCLPSFNSSSTAYGMVLLSGGILAPISAISILYILIIHIARNQAKRGTFVCNDQHCYYVPIRSYFRNTVILIVSASYLLVCWIPSVSISFYEVFYTQKVPVILKMISMWLVVLTSGINPWVNSLAQRKYRKALWESWRKLKRIFEERASISEPPSDNERQSSFQSHQCLPGHNLNLIQT